GGVGDGQGADRAGDPRAERAVGPAAGDAGLHGDSGGADGEPSVRARAGELHGGGGAPDGVLRAGAHGDVVDRRDQRAVDAVSGEGVGGDPDGGVREGGGEQADADGHPADHGVEQGSAAGGGGGVVSGGSVFPARGGEERGGAAAGAAGGHRAAGGAFLAEVFGGAPQ